MSTIYSDLNVRLPDVEPLDKVIITDYKAIKQSYIRLFKTREGEIPYYRKYGFNIEKYLHYPLTVDTGRMIYDEVKSKVSEFEQRVTILDDYSSVTIDYNRSIITVIPTAQVNKTGDVINLPPISVDIMS